jgi:hypothetical protein
VIFVGVKEGEIGKLLVVNAGFDLSGNTELRVVLTKPDGSVVTKLTADGVSAPSTPITVDVDGVSTTFNADEYFQYPTESGVITPSGAGWKIHGEYVDATPTDFCGDTTTFTVLPC